MTTVALQWINVIARLVMLCGSLYLCLDYVVVMDGVHTPMGIGALTMTFVIAVVAYVTVYFIFGKRRCGVCGGGRPV